MPPAVGFNRKMRDPYAIKISFEMFLRVTILPRELSNAHDRIAAYRSWRDDGRSICASDEIHAQMVLGKRLGGWFARRSRPGSVALSARDGPTPRRSLLRSPFPHDIAGCHLRRRLGIRRVIFRFGRFLSRSRARYLSDHGADRDWGFRSSVDFVAQRSTV
jgi:hypothetical protein